jgi:uncharacterized protein (DUF488 family)
VGHPPVEFHIPAYRPKKTIGWGTQFQSCSNFVATIYTIGHSTRTLDELVAALKGHEIRTLVDIRAFPMSRRLPHFNRESLELELPKHDIAYVWMKELGGRRKRMLDDSPNTALRDDSFRNYADYMMTKEFAAGVERLLLIAAGTADPSLRSPEATALVMTNRNGSGGTAIMCAERLYWQCHRMLVSDYLTAHGHTVLHIDDEKKAPRMHKVMAEARVMDGKLIYDGGMLL